MKTKKFSLCPSAPLAACFCLLALLAGCGDSPTDAQLEEWRKQAIARNTTMIAAHKKNRQQQQWELTIQGQTAREVRLSMQQLDALATTRIKTRSPHNTNKADEILDYRGVAISKLLELGTTPATEITFVSFDAYRATVSREDLTKYPIIIALESNGKPISRSDGGPLSLVFPYTKYPQLQQKYPDRFWAFYVTNMIVGTEPIQLRVGKSQFNAKALDQLEQVTIEEAVGYPIGWPISKVKLQGVRVRDVLAAAGVTLPEVAAVVFRGKAPASRDAKNPISILAKDIRECDILLVTRWGDKLDPIPAKMGGPVTLATSSTCQESDGNRERAPQHQRWLTFVEELEVSK